MLGITFNKNRLRLQEEKIKDLTANQITSDQLFKLSVLDKIPTPVMAIDKDYNVLYMNEVGAHALGSTSEKVVGKKCFQLFNTSDCNTANCQCAKAMNERKNCTSDTVAKLPSGELPIRYTGCALTNDRNEVIGALEYVLDISKEMEITKGLGELVDAAVDGKIDTRADESKFKANYLKIVSGVNKLIDNLVNPIKEAMKVVEQAANKDLTSFVEGDYKGQLAEFKDNINVMIESLADALGQVKEATNQISSASNQISAGSQSLAEGASEQASSIEEISSSLEEISSQTKQNADNATQANTLSSSARSSAEKGNGAMAKMSEAIEKIKNSSDETSKIVKTIDEIAFQTNLLALNAAVEAARAGEAGKGFAVVAEEVRNLAQRSAEAAKNTSELIEGSVKNADEGVKITKSVAEALGEIVEGASKVNDLVSEIAAAAKEQTQGIEQVSTAIEQMNKVTQLNASNSEESASAAEELNSQAEELMRMISEFVLPGGDINRATAHIGNRFHNNISERRQRTISSGASKKNRKSGNGKNVVNPDQLIPMDENDFAEF